MRDCPAKIVSTLSAPIHQREYLLFLHPAYLLMLAHAEPSLKPSAAGASSQAKLNMWHAARKALALRQI
eukprot:1161311-Pelagomonas_calceolata.AAC.20